METIINENQRKVEVCYSPALLPVYYSSNNCVVVVIDIFRASSAIVTAFENGVEKVIPVASIDEAREYKRQGYLVGAERHGEIVDGFDFGNSPFSYIGKNLEGKEVVLTTTNGTKAIHRAAAADKVIVGSFLNISAVCDYLEELNKDVLLLCAGWRNRYNLEDSIFAGAVVDKISRNPVFVGLSDSSIAAKYLFNSAKEDINGFLELSSHRKRLVRLNLGRDIAYCLQQDTTDVIPEFIGNSLVEHIKISGKVL